MAREIFDKYIMIELLACSHVSFSAFGILYFYILQNCYKVAQICLICDNCLLASFAIGQSKDMLL